MDPGAVPGAVRPTMRRPGAASPPPSGAAASPPPPGPTVASRFWASTPPSELEPALEVVPESDPGLVLAVVPASGFAVVPELDPEVALDAGLAPDCPPVEDAELAGLPEDPPANADPELLDEPGFAFPSTPEESPGEEQALAIQAPAPSVTHPTVLEKCICHPFSPLASGAGRARGDVSRRSRSGTAG
jgi:hypothetical protein